MALRIVIDLLIAIGLFFALAGTKGIIKMPDAFCRMQASTCISTLGVLCTAIGAVLYAILIMGSIGTAVKIGLIALLILLTNPIGSHSIAKGAYKAGIRPEKEMSVDDYGRDFE
ncbi:MAG: monovalent cation/H(+) antiporter subunit G [Oscillospiraceae bacterium]|nr:monovalent cation/H(+) antiporter subunit G [Oscillospiraceae bacterium]